MSAALTRTCMVSVSTPWRIIVRNMAAAFLTSESGSVFRRLLIQSNTYNKSHICICIIWLYNKELLQLFGTPQGDSLRPVLFTVYLKAALRDLRSRLPPRPPADARLMLDVEYADDIDFISYSMPYLNEIERIAPACLAEWSLQINAAKTERTSVSRQVDRAHEPWRTTHKLGSLLGDAEDGARRMQLANVSFHKMWTVWFRGAQISLHLRLRLYSAFVLPILTYNMGTWGLTKTELNRLDAHYRRYLRQIIGIRWPHRISNGALYRRTQSSPISAAIRAARWSLFGHVL